MDKTIIEWQDDDVQVTEISHEKLPSMPENATFMFHHTFYHKTKLDLDDTKISLEHNRNYKS